MSNDRPLTLLLGETEAGLRVEAQEEKQRLLPERPRGGREARREGGLERETESGASVALLSDSAAFEEGRAMP